MFTVTESIGPETRSSNLEKSSNIFNILTVNENPRQHMQVLMGNKIKTFLSILLFRLTRLWNINRNTPIYKKVGQTSSTISKSPSRSLIKMPYSHSRVWIWRTISWTWWVLPNVTWESIFFGNKTLEMWKWTYFSVS